MVDVILLYFKKVRPRPRGKQTSHGIGFQIASDTAWGQRSLVTREASNR